MSKAEDMYLTCFLDGRARNISIKEAFNMGYSLAEKDLTLTWEDISIIRKIMFDYNKQVRNEMAIPKEEEYCKEVLKRFLEKKGGKA